MTEETEQNRLESPRNAPCMRRARDPPPYGWQRVVRARTTILKLGGYHYEKRLSFVKVKKLPLQALNTSQQSFRRRKWCLQATHRPPARCPVGTNSRRPILPPSSYRLSELQSRTATVSFFAIAKRWKQHLLRKPGVCTPWGKEFAQVPCRVRSS